jgi:formamidopyrimidine-DNA glycosylase
MPELPEVEVTRLGLAGPLRGARIEAVYLGKPLRWPLQCLPQSLVGRTILDVRRRGKYLLMDLSDGLLLWHLGMSGSLRVWPNRPEPGPHDHFDLVTSQGCLRLNDPRRFGAVVYAPSQDSPQAQQLLGHLGVEPLEPGFEPLSFYQALHQRRTAIKPLLLGGAVVVGVGNIYACEALFMAGIRPTLSAQRISRVRAAALHGAIQQVLSRAIAIGGSSLRDFSGTEGQSGYFQLETKVYDREGLPCRECGTTVRRKTQGQRSTFYCPQCQRT